MLASFYKPLEFISAVTAQGKCIFTKFWVKIVMSGIES